MTFPLESEKDTVLDHGMVLVESLLSRQRAFTWETHYYMKTTLEGDGEFKALVQAEDWADVLLLSPDGNAMTAAFHNRLESFLSQCYVWRKVRRKSSDKPWISDGVRAQIKRRKGVFRAQGRSELWKRLDKSIKKTINYRKAQYNSSQKTRLETIRKSGQWYNIAKFLISEETPLRWNVTDLRPDQTPEALASDLAAHFSSVTNAVSYTHLTLPTIYSV